MYKKSLCAFFAKIGLISTCMLLCACSTDVYTMIDDYNENFTVANTESVTATVDNVVAEEILLPRYFVDFHKDTLSLSAPAGGVNYTWMAEVVENANNDPKGTQYLLSSKIYLDLCVKDSSLKRWGKYELTISIKTNSGEILKDTAELIVY